MCACGKLISILIFLNFDIIIIDIIQNKKVRLCLALKKIGENTKKKKEKEKD